MRKLFRGILKGIVGILALGVLLLALWATFDAWKVHRLARKASSIQTGATMDSVVALMSQPDATYPKGTGFLVFRSAHQQLAYGSAIDWRNAFSKEPPFFFPFKLRLFGPTGDDIVIVLDDNDQVLEVKIP